MKLEALTPVGIISTGFTGSKYLQSLFDSHKHVAMIPMIFEYPEFYEEAHTKSVEGAVEIVCQRLDVMLDKKYSGIHGDFRSFDISKDVFAAELSRNFGLEVPDRRKFVYEVHRAFFAATETSLEDKKILLIHIHHPFNNKFGEELEQDFPEMKCLYSVRHPAAIMHSFIGASLGYLNISLKESCNPFNLGLDWMVESWHRIQNMKRLESRSMIIRLEDLHNSLETLMEKTAQYVGIEYSDTLLKSTIGGTPFIFSGPNNKNVLGRNRSVIEPKYKKLFSAEEIRIIETVHKDYMLSCEYDFETEADFSLEEAKRVLGDRVNISRFHPKFYLPVNQRHYESAISVHREALENGLWSALFARKHLKSLLVVLLHAVGLARIFYSVATYRNKIREFSAPAMVKEFDYYDREENRIKSFELLFGQKRSN